LWKYGLGEWTWIGGSDLADQPGIYGTQGTPSPTNIPGTRKGAFAWTDQAGNFWLFGGLYPRTPAEFNDLWMYSTGEWTWVSGSNLANQPPSYGTQGTADPGNIPGARVSGASWIDPTGNLWLFGGDGYASDGFGLLNDLWKYNAGQWTWISGADIGNQLGTYGTLGTASPANVPGSRRLAVSWTDASGSLWLFGGNGYAASGGAELNDLWKYSAGQWTWMGGANVPNQSGTYGTQGTPAAGNVPGARDSAVSWADASGNFWLFGGEGYDSTGKYVELNDLWEYSSGQWTWIGGSNVGNQSGTYGTLGATASGNIPGARSTSVGWVDASGNFWLFGGEGIDSADATGALNDLWKYRP
jgi:hypothetical protein